MGFYDQRILPHLIDHVCKAKAFSELRKPFIGSLKGVGLELGVGSGFNFPFYHKAEVDKLFILEPAAGPMLNALASARDLELAVEPIEYQNTTQIPVESSSLDFVVTTWTLCTIKEVDQTLREVKRVLKPGGRYYFLEHGLSDNQPMALLQNMLNPLQKSFGGGCHLNRKIDKLIIDAGLNIVELETFYMDTIKVGAFIYRGYAVV